MSQKKHNSLGIWLWLMIIVAILAAAVGGVIVGLNGFLMALAAIVGIVAVVLIANQSDIRRYMRMRRM